MNLIDAIKTNSSEKTVWEYQYKLNFLANNGITVSDLSDNQSNPSGIAKQLIDSAVQGFCGGIMGLKFREFAIAMNQAKKSAFPKN